MSEKYSGTVMIPRLHLATNDIVLWLVHSFGVGDTHNLQYPKIKYWSVRGGYQSASLKSYYHQTRRVRKCQPLWNRVCEVVDLFEKQNGCKVVLVNRFGPEDKEVALKCQNDRSIYKFVEKGKLYD